jgi:hypothetical protein
MKESIKKVASSEFTSSSRKSVNKESTLLLVFRNVQMNAMEEEQLEIQLENIESLSPDLFLGLLRSHWKDGAVSDIRSLSVERVDQGVLSQVFRVNLEYSYRETASGGPPSSWIVKLCRDDLNLGWMFRSERAFYTHYGPRLMNENLPFSIARPLSTSSQHLILECIPDAICHDLIDGCPSDKIDFLTSALASLHAQSWNSPLFASNQRHDLIDPPGMGQRLSPLQKEYLFYTQWTGVVGHLHLESSLNDFIVVLCQRMDSLRLRDIHYKVHQERCACVHGDYHIANWLFPRNSEKPVLIDWATFGYGNPLVDVAFFLVVSTNDETVSNVEAWLEGYYHSLIHYNPTLAPKITFETILKKFKNALLCQWQILVAYDEMCRQITMAEPNPSKRRLQLKHFQNVNRRASLAMQSIENWDTILACIPKVTDEERQEAEEYSKQTPLTI